MDILKHKARFLLTDVLPYEKSIIFSNELFAKKLIKLINKNEIDLLIKSDNDFTESTPLQYYIQKNVHEKRVISCPHPLAQFNILKFIETFDTKIIDACSRSSFSIRKPKSVVSPVRNIYINNDIYGAPVITNDSNLIFSNYYNYNHKSLIKFLSGYNAVKLEKRYTKILKLDIQNCFGSIYSHSISWAFNGNKIKAKSRIGELEFSNLFDRLMQRINNNETNGIIVGPNISRLFAEVILSQIDKEVKDKLLEENYKFEKDYKILRYVDDIFIYAKEKVDLSKIQDIFHKVLEKYKLSINQSKVYKEDAPFTYGRNFIMDGKDYLNQIDAIIENQKRSFLLQFIHKFKSIYSKQETGKEILTSYIISGIVNKIKRYLESIRHDKASLNFKLLLQLQSLLFYISSIYLTYSNSVKLSLILIELQLFLDDYDDVKLQWAENVKYDLEQLIELHKDKVEITNFIIVSSFLNIDLSEKTLKYILNSQKKESDFFVITAIIFYMHKKSIKNGELFDMAMKVIEDKVQTCKSHTKYDVKYPLFSDFYYWISAFSNFSFIKRDIRIELKNIHNTCKANFSNNLLEKTKDVPFIMWDASRINIIKTLTKSFTGFDYNDFEVLTTKL